MKRQIRRMVFETNSSSTHSLTMCSVEDYNKWKSGEVLLNDGWEAKEPFISKEDVLELLKKDGVDLDDDLDDIFIDYEYYTYDSYWDSESDLEGFSETYKTKTGEEIIAFGRYGYDG